MTELCDLVTLPQLIEQRPFLSERWVRSLVRAKALPFYKPAGKLLFSLSEIDEWARTRPDRKTQMTPGVAHGGHRGDTVEVRSETERDEGPPVAPEGPPSQ
jgi:Helix-turn-helix domain